jgi:hypothetical protein
MNQIQQDAVTYLKLVYGLEPGDLDLTEGEFDIAEVDRLAEKHGLTKREDMTLDKARLTLRSLGIKL